jgi:formate-dependent nitrite reductase membrane component NrfD
MNTLPLEVTSSRVQPHIDPILHIWCWDVAAYLFLGGIAAGLLVIYAVGALRQDDSSASWPLRFAPLIALTALSVGMAFLFLDLEYKAHVYRFYLTFRPSSPMSWGSWILVVTYPTGILMAAGGLSAARERTLLSRLGSGVVSRIIASTIEFAGRHRKTILRTGVAVGIGLGLYTGLLLGTLSARIQWNTALLGPLFLASGISTGIAFLLLFPLRDAERHDLTRWDITAIGVELTLIGLMLIGFLSGDEAARLAARNLLGGPVTGEFWSLVVIAGLAVPLLLELIEIRRAGARALMAPVLVLAGGIALRFILLHAGQATSYDTLLSMVGN